MNTSRKFNMGNEILKRKPETKAGMARACLYIYPFHRPPSRGDLEGDTS